MECVQHKHVCMTKPLAQTHINNAAFRTMKMNTIKGGEFSLHLYDPTMYIVCCGAVGDCCL